MLPSKESLPTTSIHDGTITWQNPWYPRNHAITVTGESKVPPWIQDTSSQQKQIGMHHHCDLSRKSSEPQWPISYPCSERSAPKLPSMQQTKVNVNPMPPQSLSKSPPSSSYPICSGYPCCSGSWSSSRQDCYPRELC